MLLLFIRSKVDFVSLSSCITLEAEWTNIILSLNLGTSNIEDTVSFVERFWYLKKSHIFKNMSDNRLIEMCKVMRVEEFTPNTVIIEEGSQGDKLYLLQTGKVQVCKDTKVLRDLESGSCFGETSLLLDSLHTATVVTGSDKVVLLTISKELLLDKFLDKNMVEFMKRKILYQNYLDMQLEDLMYLKQLGSGKFGNVCLVRHGNNIYAAKSVPKKMAEKQTILIRYFQKERQILLSLDHPFIVKLVRTFRNEANIFFLMEFINGIALDSYIEKRTENKVRDKYSTQFYIASLLVTVDYLNSRRIAHRDIKPSNIMLDETGYMKLVDFGTAAVIKDFTSTITGTPHFMAPEILLGKGYSLSVDYWSIGITAFQLFYNFYPFGHKAKDPMDIYREVLRKYLFCLHADRSSFRNISRRTASTR